MNIVTQDPKAWEAGFKAGEQGRLGPSPYPTGSREDWSWHSGHVEGDAKRQGFNYACDGSGGRGAGVELGGSTGGVNQAIKKFEDLPAQKPTSNLRIADHVGQQ